MGFFDVERTKIGLSGAIKNGNIPSKTPLGYNRVNKKLETELNEIREKYSSIDLMPLERQQELFDEIVLGKKKEEVKSLKLKKNENN